MSLGKPKTPSVDGAETNARSVGLIASRTYSEIATWEEFLGRLQLTGSQEEVLGLLDMGFQVPYRPWGGQEREPLVERVEAYIVWSRHADCRIAAKAAQTIARDVLRRLHYGPGEGPLNLSLLEFFQTQTVPERLAYEPYPRYIQNYLTGLANSLASKNRKDTLTDFCDPIEPLFKKLMRAFLLWGLAGQLTDTTLLSIDDRLEIINDFLAERQFTFAMAMGELFAEAEPPKDLRPERVQLAISVNAFKALHALKYE